MTNETTRHEQVSDLELEPVQTLHTPARLAPEVLAMLSDDELVGWWEQQQDATFEVLYHRHRAAVVQVCRKWLSDRDSVDDAVQETFTRALRGMPGFNGGERFEHWLRRIAKRVCIDVHRLRTRRSTSQLSQVNGASERLDDDWVQRITVGQLLNTLSPNDATLLIEHHGHDVPLRQLAARLRRPERSVAVSMHRARARLRRLAQANGLGGLTPVPLLARLTRRMPAWFSRTTTLPPLAGLPTAMEALIAITIIAVATPSEQAQAVVAPAADEQHATARLHPVSASVDTSADGRGLWSPRPILTTPVPNPRRRPAAATHPEAIPQSNQSEAVMPFAPVAIPGTNRQLSSDAPQSEPDFAYRADVDVGDGPHSSVTLEMYNEAELEPVNRPACRTVSTAPTVLSCEPKTE